MDEKIDLAQSPPLSKKDTPHTQNQSLPDEEVGSIAVYPEAVLKHADAANADEALTFFQAHAQEAAAAMTPAENKRLLRKIDRNLMPLLCIVYGLNFLDKTTVSYASIMGFKKDTHLIGQDYSWVASMFYFGYLAWEWPTNYLLQRLPLAKWSAVNVILWGLMLCCMAAVHNFGQAMAVRFLLGVFEAAVSPGFALFTSQWYTMNEQGTRVAIWFSFNGVAQIVGGFVAYGIAVGTENHPLASGLKAWQLLFMVIGFFTAFVGGLFLYFMPDSQLNARFLTPHEQVMAIERIRVNQQGIGNKHFKKYQFIEALTDPVVWAICFFAIVTNIPNGGITNYFSQLIVSFGFTSQQSLLLGTPGGVVEIVSLVGLGILGDRYRNRLLFSLVGTVTAFVGMLLITVLDNSSSHRVGRLIGYYMMQASAAPFVAMLSLIATNIAGWTKKTTVAALYLIFYCVGNIIGPQVFRNKDAPEYRPAEITILSLAGVCIANVLFIYWWWRRQNTIKAAKRAEPGYTRIDGQEFYDLTDRENLEFVYSL
ncbi:mfs allantoate [Ophiostoma piceae UAMH 11346]|uniref:Mfs allantoate n=1 Tax=Ophiostoma piceae (strain UAMH 11346) TaxID=1262450 RepID=S3BQ31_OPHP1|nr:mfs allantoate [Ophiostoma piceae UAMH 11346]